ncbi:hypothetical protein, partial [Allofranklinella schreckenbergeri]|uniref:hypothetical protein n=1 Tax=Allofranklinella schreckenbergeri TaxID=1076744 RepID=UPI001EEDD9AE
PDDWMRVKIRRYAAKRWQDFCRRVPKISYQARVVGDLSRFSVHPQPLVAEALAAVVLVQLPFAAPQVPRRLIPHPVVYGQPGVMLVPSLVGGVRVDAAGWRYRPLQLSTTSEKIRVYRRLMDGDLSGFSATLARLMHERVAQRRSVLRQATYSAAVSSTVSPAQDARNGVIPLEKQPLVWYRPPAPSIEFLRKMEIPLRKPPSGGFFFARFLCAS